MTVHEVETIGGTAVAETEEQQLEPSEKLKRLANLLDGGIGSPQEKLNTFLEEEDVYGVFYEALDLQHDGSITVGMRENPATGYFHAGIKTGPEIYITGKRSTLAQTFDYEYLVTLDKGKGRTIVEAKIGDARFTNTRPADSYPLGDPAIGWRMLSEGAAELAAALEAKQHHMSRIEAVGYRLTEEALREIGRELL